MRIVLQSHAMEKLYLFTIMKECNLLENGHLLIFMANGSGNTKIQMPNIEWWLRMANFVYERAVLFSLIHFAGVCRCVSLRVSIHRWIAFRLSYTHKREKKREEFTYTQMSSEVNRWVVGRASSRPFGEYAHINYIWSVPNESKCQYK